MNDLDKQFDEKMTAEMTAVDRGIAPPAVDIAAIARLGRGERRRRTGILASGVAAAAVVATVGALALVPGTGRPTSSPDPVTPASAPTSTADLPEGEASLAPYVRRGVLYGSGSSSAFDLVAYEGVQFAGGTTLVTERVDGSWRVMQLREGESVEYARGPGGRGPSVRGELSEDGRTVAVTRPIDRAGEDPATEVSLYDADTATRLGSIQVPRVAGIGSPGPVSVTADRRVVWFQDNEGVFIWSPGSPAVPVTGLQGGFASYGGNWPGGFATDSRDGTETVFGTIDEQGASIETGRTPRAPGYSWGPSEDAWVITAYSDTDRSVYVEGPDRESTVLLPLAGDAYADAVGWESATDVVLDISSVDDDAVTRVRCDVTTLECERVPLPD